MKYLGIAVIAFGIWLTSISWYDSRESRYVRPIGVGCGLVGLFTMLEGFKRAIIRGVRGDDGDRLA